MEGAEAPVGVEELLLGGNALPDLDRRALASHCAAVAHHMSAIARLFDPLCVKPAPDGRKSKKAGAGADDDDKAAKPKRELTAYNLFIQSKLAQVKEEHPELTHTEAFAQAAHAWKTDPSNPKTQVGEDKRKAHDDGAAGLVGDDAAHKKHKKFKGDEA